MRVAGAVALVTGANRGIGRRVAEHLLERGARKVYAGVRTAEVELSGMDVLPLDITDRESVRAAADIATDVTLSVHNAGINTNQPLLTGNDVQIRREMDTLHYGTLDTTRAFAPVLAANGGGAVINVRSASSWFSHPGNPSYAVAKAAAWAQTNGVRLEMAEYGTQIVAVHLGAVDTDFSAGYDGPKISTTQVATATLDGLVAGRIEVLVDDASTQIEAALAGNPAHLYTPEYIREGFLAAGPVPPLDS